MSNFERIGGWFAIPFAILALGGLGLWFYGADMPEDGQSAAQLADRANSVGIALTGAALLIAAMLCLLAYALWLRKRYSSNATIGFGAAVIALGGLTHAVENMLVLRLYSGDIASGDGLWDVISSMSFIAFGVLGVGALIVAIGLPSPAWLRGWGVIAGALGLGAALSYFAPALQFLPGPFNVGLLAWMITLGLRRPAARESQPA